MIRGNCLLESEIDKRQIEGKGGRGKTIIEKIKNIRNTVGNLEKRFAINEGLQMQQWVSISSMRMRNGKLCRELTEAEKLNETMLNLFRQNVTIDNFPQKIRKDIQRSWHQKYDALLKLNEQSRRQIHAKDAIIKEKNYQIDILQQKLIDTGNILMERDESIRNICNKYLILKKRKDEEELLLRGSIESLQDFLHKNKPIQSKDEKTKTTKMSLTPSKDDLLDLERRRNERLIRENNFLRNLIEKTRQKIINNHYDNLSSDSESCLGNIN